MKWLKYSRVIENSSLSQVMTVHAIYNLFTSRFYDPITYLEIEVEKCMYRGRNRFKLDKRSEESNNNPFKWSGSAGSSLGVAIFHISQDFLLNEFAEHFTTRFIVKPP